ncbi:FAD-dependent oxidoreductase [Caulobacter segnis]|uniref:FAD-dependent oxidoreductase n=1 Tax=Caulobacter segnis TaxID=88688 RepID=UPI0024104FE7|nr:FAD-dependent oxidoreductase [Caulobacter segnis]MDG2520210.1 FAD-dependent oxidoreductase [Caulobacter segnis]
MSQTAPRLDRRSLIRMGAALGGLQALGGCATVASQPTSLLMPAPGLAPVRARPENIFNITVCSRPFRAAGPRLDAETVGDKLVVHNYGHGGSGWSLSWGSAEIVVGKALAGGEKDIAVIGCGAMGLTAAITAQRAGARVTIYAKELMPDVRSARATGVWSPDSRIALSSQAPAGFDVLWEQMCRRSWKTYARYLGVDGEPVSWTDRYVLSDKPFAPSADPMGFAHYERMVPDLTPRPQTLAPGEHPFRVAHARRVPTLMFNVMELGRTLMGDFLVAGGRLEVMDFKSPADLAALKQKVVINCTGYGARALWKDETVTPVRGQLAWLPAQPEVTYGLYYRHVSMLARRDGIILQQTGADESYGYGIEDERPDRAEAEAAIRTIAALFAKA